MNRPIAYLLMVVLFGWLIGMATCHYRTCPDCISAAAAIPPVVPEKAELAISIEDTAPEFESATNDNLLFAKSACEYQSPLSDDLMMVFKNTVQHLNDNPTRKLELTGLYENEEGNNCGDYSDLGIARAERVKALLIEMGGPEGRIDLEASDLRDLQDYDEMVVGGVDYNFSEITVEEGLRAEGIILRFATNKQEINLDAQQQNYFERLKAYLAQNPDARASVTGHTDDRGNDRGNIRLSRKRSEFVRDYMIDQGIPKNQIVNEGMGPDVPVSTNDTDEGRALNRRVEITLQ